MLCLCVMDMLALFLGMCLLEFSSVVQEMRKKN